MRPLIQLRDVWKLYHLGDVEVRALRGVSLDIRAGEFLAIVGASGSGKSTCMNLIGCLDQPTRGTYRLGDVDVSTLSVNERAAIRSRRIGFVFQNFNLLGRLTALENVALPMIYANVPFAEQRRRARELLAAVGLRGRDQHMPSQLSGGQQQRVAIARALANGPSLLLADEPTGNLDTQSSTEIMDLFLRLRRERRLTIVVVTHEPHVADYTERIVTFRDGRIVFRSALTMLGVIIGVAAVLTMVSIGRGANAAVQREIQSLGNNLVMIIPGATTANGVHSGSGSAASLTVADATAITKECPAVADVAWAKRQVVQVVYGNQNWATAAHGVPPSYLSLREWALSAGRSFDQRDDAGANAVAVLGQTVVDQLFEPGEDPIGATIRVKNVPFTVIGVLARKGQTAWGQDQDDVVLMPFLTAERRVLGTKILGTVDMIVVSTTAADALPKVEEQVSRLLHERHRIPPGQDDDFTVRDLNEIAEASKKAREVMTNLLLSVASVSLLVGGIGIMNIMLVSVTERTREIGVRLAVGARTRHILFQFLVEATALSLVGGAAGVVLGIGATRLIARLAEWPTLLSVPAAAGAFLVAGAIGIFFGFYPARRAAQLDPIAALRYE